HLDVGAAHGAAVAQPLLVRPHLGVDAGQALDLGRAPAHLGFAAGLALDPAHLVAHPGQDARQLEVGVGPRHRDHAGRVALAAATGGDPNRLAGAHGAEAPAALVGEQRHAVDVGENV